MDGNGITFSVNLRFPGQYFDSETGLNYNYFRDYDAANGRYIQSDPIGLAGGINTYAYVRNNPLKFIDSSGLNPLSWTIEGAELGTMSCGPYCGIVGGVIGFGAGHWASNEFLTWYNNQAHTTSNPLTGEPGSESTCNNKKGNPKQTRRYAPDGFPEIDTDWDHSHDGLGKPHSHDWGRPSDGDPTNADRGPGRLPQPGDPGFR